MTEPPLVLSTTMHGAATVSWEGRRGWRFENTFTEIDQTHTRIIGRTLKVST